MEAPLTYRSHTHLRDPELRQIDLEYQIMKTCETSEKQHQSSIQMIEAIQANSETMLKTASSNERHMGNLERGVVKLREVTADGFKRCERLLGNISEGIRKQIALLESINEILASPLETRTRELRENAERSIQEMLTCEGRDRDEYRSDAISLIELVIADPVGKLDYLAWFNYGWLLQYEVGSCEQAEEAFFQSRRLAKSDPEFRLIAIRFYANCLYHMGKYQEAYDAFREVETHDLFNDYRAAYEYARYCARLEFTDLATQSLERAIELFTLFGDLMWCESDFLEGDMDLQAIYDRAVDTIENRALGCKQAAQKAQSVIHTLADAVAPLASNWPHVTPPYFEIAMPTHRLSLATYEDEVDRYAIEVKQYLKDSLEYCGKVVVRLQWHEKDLAKQRNPIEGAGGKLGEAFESHFVLGLILTILLIAVLPLVFIFWLAASAGQSKERELIPKLSSMAKASQSELRIALKELDEFESRQKLEYPALTAE